MIQASLMALSFIKPDQSKFYIAGIGIFYLFYSCDLDLDPITFIYELDPYSRIPWRYTACASMNFVHQGFRKLSSDRQTDRQTDTYTTEIIYHGASQVVKYCEENTVGLIKRRRSITTIAFKGQKSYTATQTSNDRLNSRSVEIGCLLAYFFSSLRP